MSKDKGRPKETVVLLRENGIVTVACCDHSKPIFSVILYFLVNLPPNLGWQYLYNNDAGYNRVTDCHF